MVQENVTSLKTSIQNLARNVKELSSLVEILSNMREENENRELFNEKAQQIHEMSKNTNELSRKLVEASSSDTMEKENQQQTSEVSEKKRKIEEQTTNHDEHNYLNQIVEILKNGELKTDRTGTGTISISGMQSKYSLRDGTIPLLTTKRVYWKGVVEELLWFISGSTDEKVLGAKNVKIWEKNGDRSFLDNLGFTQREEGDLGPVYGFQWRHFGAKYVDCHTDYSGQGVDQLASVIQQIKENPDSRRIILSAWNPLDLDQMVLPPCHTFSQFIVTNGELTCVLYQRSGDMGLGVPFNLASYGLLTHMIAKVTGLKPGNLVHCLGDAHIYSNHVEALKVQIERQPYEFPKINFTREVSSIDDFTSDMIVLEGYKCHPKIAMEMAV